MSATAVIAVAGLGVGALAALAALAVMLRQAERSSADARVIAAELQGKLAIEQATTAGERARGDTEKRRADALDQELDRVAADGDVAGARARVLAAWGLVPTDDPGATADRDPGPVPSEPGPAPDHRPDRDGLERPG